MKINVTYRRALYAAAVLGILEDIEIIANHVGALVRVWVLVLSGINIQGRREEKFLRGPLRSALCRYVGIYAITVTDTATNQTTWAVWKAEKVFPEKRTSAEWRSLFKGLTPGIVFRVLKDEGARVRPVCWSTLAILCFAAFAIGAATKGWVIVSVIGTALTAVNLALLTRYRKATE